MPSYELTCTNPACGHQFSDFHSMTADHPRCPECRSPTEVAWDRQGAPKVPAHDLHGTRQQLQDVQCQPHEVKKCRELFGPGVGHVWQEDGSVKVASPSEARKFYTKQEQLKRRFADDKAAGKLVTKKERIAMRRAKQAARAGART